MNYFSYFCNNYIIPFDGYCRTERMFYILLTKRLLTLVLGCSESRKFKVTSKNNAAVNPCECVHNKVYTSFEYMCVHTAWGSMLLVQKKRVCENLEQWDGRWSIPRFLILQMNDLPIIIPSVKEITLLRLEEIVCFAFEEGHWNVYISDGRTIKMNRTCKEKICAFSEQFVVINCHLIFNINKIVTVENNTFVCRINTDIYKEEVKFSKREYTGFVAKLKKK